MFIKKFYSYNNNYLYCIIYLDIYIIVLYKQVVVSTKRLFVQLIIVLYR